MNYTEKKACTEKEQPKDSFAASKSGFASWIKSNKGTLILIGVSVPVLIGVVAGIKNKGAIMDFWKKLMDEINKVELYSNEWLTTVSEEVLHAEREKIRLAYCASGDNPYDATRYEHLLRRFDKELSKRAWGDRIPCTPSIHREHGWYLTNDE